MKIPLSYITQIRGSDQAGAIIEGRTPEERALGGWVALSENEIVASVAAGYHTEHHDNDTHSDIHCDTIRERSRTVPIGEWTNDPPDPSRFTASGTMTWTVPTAGQTYRYMLVGKTMYVQATFGGTTVGGVVSTDLRLTIPGSFVGKGGQGTFHLVDAGTYEIGLYQVTSGNTYIQLFRQNFLANWVAGTVDIRGMLIFEVQ